MNAHPMKTDMSRIDLLIACFCVSIVLLFDLDWLTNPYLDQNYLSIGQLIACHELAKGRSGWRIMPL